MVCVGACRIAANGICDDGVFLCAARRLSHTGQVLYNLREQSTCREHALCHGCSDAHILAFVAVYLL